MSGTQAPARGSGIIPLTPEEAAALPGPPVTLPTIPAPPEQVIEVTEPRAAPELVAPTAPEAADAAIGAPAPSPLTRADIERNPPPLAPADLVLPAPNGNRGRPVSGAEDGTTPGLRTMQGPRGTVAAMPDNIQEVAGLLDRLRGLSRVRPEVAPPVRAQDFVEIDSRRILVRAATTDEVEEVGRIMGQQTPETIRLISTRGDYMPTDVQEFISAVRQANQSLFDELKRGTQTREQMIAAAQQLGLDGAVDALLRRQPGETFNAEQLIGSGLALINARRETDASRAALLAAPPGTPEEAAALRRYGLNHALTAALAGQANGATAEAGRALGALRFIGDALAQMPPEAFRDVSGRLRGMGANGGPAMSDDAIIDMLGGADALRTSAALWGMLPDQAARARFAQRTMGARVIDALIAAYVNSLLWLPTTHLKNIMGTGSMMLWQVPERALAGAIGAVRSRIPGMSDERVVMSEALAQLYGMWAGQAEALAAAREAFRTGMPAGGVSRLELPRANPISAEALQLSGTPGRAIDVMGAFLTAPGRALVTADSYFQTIGARTEFLAQAVRQRDAMLAAGVPPAQVEREIEAMLAAPPQMWADAAEATARSMVFQQEMEGGLAKLRDVMQQPFAKLFVPFFNTPTNVARAVLNRTPVALMYPSQAWADIRAGGARADLALSRIALGSMMLYVFSGLVMNSASDPDFRITGQEPTAPARRENWRRQGLQPYSVCHRADGGWQCSGYSGLDPLSALMAMAADTTTYTLDRPGDPEAWTGDAEALAMGGVFGLYNYLLQQPFLTGVSEITRTMGDSRLDAQDRARKMVELLTQRVTGAALSPLPLPFPGTLGAGIERAVDPTLRSTMPTDPAIAQEGPVVRGFYAALRQAQGRIPGQSSGMEPQLNIWGEPIQPNEGGLWALFWPFRFTEGMTSRLEEEMLRLGGVISLPDKKFPGTSVELTARQYTDLIRAMNAPNDAGLTMRDEMAALVESPGFSASSPADQIAQLRGIRSERWQIAQEQVLGIDMDLNIRVQRDREYRRYFGRPPRPDSDAAPTLR